MGLKLENIEEYAREVFQCQGYSIFLKGLS
jgi:hypothetical protein